MRIEISSMPMARGPGVPAFAQLCTHVLLVERFDRIPVQMEFLGNALDRAFPTAPAHIMRKPFRVERIVRKPLQPLPFHAPAPATLHPPYFNLQVDPNIPTGEIANTPHAPVVPACLHASTAATDRFFERRTRVTTRAPGSPKMPRITGSGRNPGNLYASPSPRFRFLEFDIR